MADAKEEKKKTKLPTAEKRLKQSKKKCLLNRSAKSRLRTAKNAFTALSTKEEKQESLGSLYSHLDKAVKRGFFSKNKAARLKSRLAKKVSA